MIGPSVTTFFPAFAACSTSSTARLTPKQNPALLAAFPAGLRSQSARLLTDLLAADVSALEDTLTYLSTRPALAVDYVTAETAKAKGGVCLTDEGMAAVRDLLS